jgi:hypothetical protein
MLYKSDIVIAEILKSARIYVVGIVGDAASPH